MRNQLYPTKIPHPQPYFPASYLPADEPAWKLNKKRRIRKELRDLDVWPPQFWRTEMHSLPDILHDDEHIMGVVYGYGSDGFAMLMATDRRVLYIDKKPMFLKTDEITYDLVGGITHGRVWPFETVTLHTRLGDYKLRAMNFAAAAHFIDFIERRCLEHLNGRNANEPDNYPTMGWPY